MSRGVTGTIRVAVAAVFAAAALAAAGAGAAEGSKQPSGCVTCHTDMARLQEEAKGIPIPAGSALQSGKG